MKQPSAPPQPNWLTRVSAWDARLAAPFTQLVKSRPGYALATLLAHSGDGLLWLGVGLVLWWRGKSATAGRVLKTTVLASMISGLLKELIRRPRPATEGEHFYLPVDKHAFPSGHVTRITALITLWHTDMGLPRWMSAALVLWGGAVAISRVALGLHYLGDVGAGVLLGTLIGSLHRKH